MICGYVALDQSHLFFECRYIINVLQQIKTWLGINCECTRYMEIIQWIKKRYRRSKFQKHICYFVLAATVYFIWQVRNESLRLQKVSCIDHCVSRIKEAAIGRIHAVKPVKVSRLDS